MSSGMSATHDRARPEPGGHRVPVDFPQSGRTSEFDSNHRLKPAHHRGKRLAVVSLVHNLMRDDRVILGIDRCLHVVFDDTCATTARGHRAPVGSVP